MAIVILGKSKCPICGDVISSQDEIVSFPAFIHDSNHRLWAYNDAAMHQRCFVGWSEAAEYRKLFDSVWNAENPNHPRMITEDGSIIEK